MQQHLEDYAFLVSYSPERLRKQAVRLGGAVKGRLISLMMSLAIVLLLWWRGGNLVWPDGPTRVVLVLFAVSGLVVAVVGVAAWRGAAAPLRQIAVVWRYVLLGATAAALAGAWIVVVELWRLGVMADEAGTRQGTYRLVLWTYLGLVAVVTIAHVAALVVGIRWTRRQTHASPGYMARWTAQVATAGGYAMVGLGAVALLLARNLVPDMTADMTERFAWLDDLGMWGLMALLCLSVVLLVYAVVQVIDMTVLAGTLVEGPALRLDPLGLVIDDPAGPTRIPWADLREIGAKAHTPLPGPELWLKRQGGPDWLVPFGFLDVMPGTIDSAIRAHTTNVRTLDLARLNRVW